MSESNNIFNSFFFFFFKLKLKSVLSCAEQLANFVPPKFFILIRILNVLSIPEYPALTVVGYSGSCSICGVQYVQLFRNVTDTFACELVMVSTWADREDGTVNRTYQDSAGRECDQFSFSLLLPLGDISSSLSAGVFLSPLSPGVASQGTLDLGFIKMLSLLFGLLQ